MSQASHCDPAASAAPFAADRTAAGEARDLPGTTWITGSHTSTRVPGAASRIAWTPATVARTSCRFSSHPRPRVPGFMPAMSAPAQEK